MYFKKKCLIIACLFLFPVAGVQCQQLSEPCQFFYNDLKDLPNEQLTFTTGSHTSIANRQKYEGCEVKFVTSDTAVTNNYSFFRSWTNEESDIYQKGWRLNDQYTADGPGSRSFRLENKDKLCAILESQPATREAEGKITQSSTLTIIVQCRDKDDK